MELASQLLHRTSGSISQPRTLHGIHAAERVPTTVAPQGTTTCARWARTASPQRRCGTCSNNGPRSTRTLIFQRVWISFWDDRVESVDSRGQLVENGKKVQRMKEAKNPQTLINNATRPAFLFFWKSFNNDYHRNSFSFHPALRKSQIANQTKLD